VRAQVDHDLTIVDYFDRLLGLIKNLGRHIHLPPEILLLYLWLVDGLLVRMALSCRWRRLQGFRVENPVVWTSLGPLPR
jgi:hypothetical protein